MGGVHKEVRKHLNGHDILEGVTKIILDKLSERDFSYLQPHSCYEASVIFEGGSFKFSGFYIFWVWARWRTNLFWLGGVMSLGCLRRSGW